jgi:peptidoglycan/LPS O-acetylase OafA/YrhL
MHRPALQRLDPWLSYLLIIAFAYAASAWVERPGRRWMERTMGIASDHADEKKPPGLASVVTPIVS